MARITVIGACLFILIMFLGCYQNASQKQLKSGIEGQVRFGPLSAVVSSKNPVNDRPYQATLKILDLDRKEVTQIETDSEGRFKVALAPGEYIIAPVAPNPFNPPYPEEQQVTVKADEFAEVTVHFDSGIR